MTQVDGTLDLHAPIGKDVAKLATVLAEHLADQEAPVTVARLPAAAE